MRSALTTARLCTATMLLPCAHAQHSDTVTNQFTGLAETPASSPDKELGVEVLSVSVSKLARDSFGNPMNPFNSFNLNEADPGTVLLAKITPREAAPWELQPDRCRVVSFTDDVGTDLSTNAAPKSEDHFFPRNRPLDMLTAREQGRSFGVRIRSSRVPAPTANRLIADVSLLFRIGSEERTEQRTDVLLQTNEMVTVGPLQVKFLVGSSARNPFAPTNPPAAQTQVRHWLAAFRPQGDIGVASVTFFSAKSDEPILVAKNITAEGVASSYHPGVTEQWPKSRSSDDPFANCVWCGFTPPEDGRVTIKLRYYDAKSLVEKHCIISTGLSP
jgi:hypothetical protein